MFDTLFPPGEAAAGLSSDDWLVQCTSLGPVAIGQGAKEWVLLSAIAYAMAYIAIYPSILMV